MRKLAARKISEIAKLYHKILVEQENLDSSYYQGPNGMVGEERAAKRLIRELIPQYRKIVPLEVQRHLDINLSNLERECKKF